MYEYKVVPAPVRAAKAKGLKTTATRFSHALAECINAEAAGGWQFQRTETLACEERSRLGRVRASTQTVMIFARATGAVRPDAGVAITAAQVAETSYEAEAYDAPQPDYEAPAAEQYAEPEYDAPAYDEPAYEEPVQEEPEPAPAPQPRRQPSRQEPLFSSSAMKRPDLSTRAEPVLRPRPQRSEDDA